MMKLWKEEIWKPYVWSSTKSVLLLEQKESHIDLNFNDAPNIFGSRVIEIPEKFASCQSNV